MREVALKEKIPMIVIEGPTASGKTAYAVSLAGELGGEIISGDSMQVYRGMDIGTAKPTKAEMNGIPHHLIDVADIGESFSAARFVSLAGKAAADIHSRGRVPVVVGGTGLYVDTLVSGISLAETECDEELRAGLYDFARENGAQALHERLANVDPPPQYIRTISSVSCALWKYFIPPAKQRPSWMRKAAAPARGMM